MNKQRFHGKAKALLALLIFTLAVSFFVQDTKAINPDDTVIGCSDEYGYTILPTEGVYAEIVVTTGTWRVMLYSTEYSLYNYAGGYWNANVSYPFDPADYGGGSILSVLYSLGYNVTRNYDTLPTTDVESIRINVPHSTEVFNIYTFNFVDISSATWEYLEFRLPVGVGASMKTISRYQINGATGVSVPLVWGRTYDMRLVTDLGTVDLAPFTAGATGTNAIAISDSLFYVAPNDSNELTLTATRSSSTNEISMLYSNPYSDTLNTTFLLYQQGHSTPVFNETYTSQDSISATYGDAEAVTYTAQLTTYTAGLGKITKTITLRYDLPPSGHPFAILRQLGNLPFDAANIPALAILFVLALAIGWWHLPWGIILEVIFTGILVYIQWLALEWSWVGTVAAIGFLLAFSEQKSRETG